jgi:hypothetical protein
VESLPRAATGKLPQAALAELARRCGAARGDTGTGTSSGTSSGASTGRRG